MEKEFVRGVFFSFRFHIYPWLFDCERRGTLEMGHQLSMLESALIFLCAIVGFRANISKSD